MPSVAIVILNYNGKKFLQQFLPSVLSTTYPEATVIVADNASTDDSVSFLHEHYPSIKIISNSKNEGFAKGYNAALKFVEADYLMLLNSDVEVTPGWIEPLIELMESNECIAACQPKLLSFFDKSSFEYAGACGGWIDSFGYPFSRGRVFDYIEKDTGQYDDVQPVFWASGAAFLIRKKLFDEAGGFDEYFFAHQEEIDLCWRLQRAGYKIYVQPASVVYHVGGGTLPKGNSRKTFLNFRNNLIMMAKNMRTSEAIYKISVRSTLDGLAATKFLLLGDVGGWLAIIKAYLYFWKWLFTKKKSFSKRSSSTVIGRHKGLIIWDYYVRKKKRFSEIVLGKK